MDKALLLGLSDKLPKLKGLFESDLHSGGAGVGKEDMVEPAWT
jgi:hypothetical protein